MTFTQAPDRPDPARRWCLLQALAFGAGVVGCASPVRNTPEAEATPPPPPVAPVVLAPTAPPELLPRPPRIGLALGGGAARGFAHIGVIQVLEEAGIRPDLVVGTSAGSLVAALYASGKSGTDLTALADSMDETAFADCPIRAAA